MNLLVRKSIGAFGNAMLASASDEEAREGAEKVLEVAAVFAAYEEMLKARPGQTGTRRDPGIGGRDRERQLARRVLMLDFYGDCLTPVVRRLTRFGN
jgi:hypothetical protein